MIDVIWHKDTEIRVLRAIMSRPVLILDVPELETEDLHGFSHRLLWTAIRGVQSESMPDTAEAMRTACSEYLIRQQGALLDNMYGLVATELLDARANPQSPPQLDRKILSTDTRTSLTDMRVKLLSDVAELKMVCRARQQMKSQQNAAAIRIRS